METGKCFVHRGIWPRTDLLSHPELSPPAHGALAYCETGFVWAEAERERGFGMFPFFAEAGYFEAPPVADTVTRGPKVGWPQIPIG